MACKLVSAVTVLLLFVSCDADLWNNDIDVQYIENPLVVHTGDPVVIVYPLSDSSDICDTYNILDQGLLDSSSDIVAIGFWGDSTTGGISGFSWDGIQKWSVEYGTYGYAAGICVCNDSVFFSVLDEIPVVDAMSGEYLLSFSTGGMSDSLMLPVPGDYMPAPKFTPVMEIRNNTLLWMFHKLLQKISYCGFITDFDYSYQRYLRIHSIGEQWYIGMTEGHFDTLSLYKVPEINYSLQPCISNMVLTDSSVIAALSYRDLVMEFDYNGQLIRTTNFGHRLSGPTQFTCTFPVSFPGRFLLADLDTDSAGNIYLLYTGYGVGQNGNAEIWRVNTVTGEARMARLDHSGSAFTVCGDRVAVVVQTYEPGEGEEVVLLGTPSVYLYRIDWGV